jgi:hypothetical protein
MAGHPILATGVTTPMALIGGGSATPKGQIKKKKKDLALGGGRSIPKGHGGSFSHPQPVHETTPKKLGPHNSSTHCLHYPIPRLKSHRSTPQPTKPPKHEQGKRNTSHPLQQTRTPPQRLKPPPRFHYHNHRNQGPDHLQIHQHHNQSNQ